ncbi:MAG TPA: hypothetical protein VNK46_02700 [Nitrospiraceae bacterium]|jgi:hypothetical protein|nr:hypothetical protein [Nitrospiraceae bacterium]
MIIVSDAGCDPQFVFQDLGNAIRKIRVDLGTDIDINVDMLRRRNQEGRSRWHHAIGTIRYYECRCRRAGRRAPIPQTVTYR